MKPFQTRISTVAFIGIMLTLSVFCVQSAAASGDRYESRTIICRFDDSALNKQGRPMIDFAAGLGTGSIPAISSLGLPEKVLANEHLRGIYRMEVPEGENVDAWLDVVSSTPGVLWAEMEPVRYTCELPLPGRDGTDAPPGDPYYHLQWYLHRISAEAAWDIATGDTNVTVAVVDIGNDLTHPDLISQYWRNWEEADGEEGVDDDGNGFIDDIYGWDFQDNDNDPGIDNNDQHGTHVSGIIAAATDNGYGIAGICWNARIIPVRVGRGNVIWHGYEGIIYAAACGADIINVSWGSDTPSNIEKVTVDYANSQGSLVIAAAGNTYAGGDFLHYPAAYEGVIGVAATTTGDRLAGFSNYGDWVTISAPGDTILSTFADGFGVSSGTSMATPVIAGAAALIKSQHPEWSPVQITRQLTATADPIDYINPERQGMIGAGRVNLFRALSEQHSGFELVSLDVSDLVTGDGDDIIEPNETIQVTVMLRNVLEKETHVFAGISSDDRNVSINPVSVDLGTLATGESAGNTDFPFELTVAPRLIAGTLLECQLDIEFDNGIQSIPFQLAVRSRYDSHDNGNVVLTLTDFGSLGYYDYLNSDPDYKSQGFRYPRDGLSALFHGSLLVGAPGAGVADCAYGDSMISKQDFFSSGEGFVIRDFEDYQQGIAGYSNSDDQGNLAVSVVQTSISYADAPHDEYVTICYEVINEGDYLDSAYIGLYLDWDVLQSGSNAMHWDSEDAFGWAEYLDGIFPVFGAAVLNRPADFNVALDNDNIFTEFRTWSDETKLVKMMSGFSESEGDEAHDWSQLIGVGPVELETYESVTVVFGLAGGDDVEELKTSLNLARTHWQSQPFGSDNNSVQPGDFRLLSLYPSPFNGSMRLDFKTDNPGSLAWSLCDPMGREVMSAGYVSVSAGKFTIPLTVTNLPSGRYIGVFRLNGQSLSVPVTLIK